MVFSIRGWYSPYWPLALMSVLFLLYWMFAEALSERLGKVFKQMNVGENLDSVDEVLDNYWSSLSKLDKNWSVKEEEYRRHALDMKMMTDEQYSRMKSGAITRQRKKRGRLFNTHTYDILANPYYVKHFQYITAAVGGARHTMIVDSDSDEDNDSAQSDLVRICINLAYLPEARGRAFQYDKELLSKETTLRLQSFKESSKENSKFIGSI